MSGVLDWIVLFQRTIQFAAAAVLFGTPLFYLYAKPRPQHWHGVLAAAAVAGFLAASVLAAWTQSALLLEKWPQIGTADIWWYLTETHIGQIILARFAAAAAYALLLRSAYSANRHVVLSAVGGAILASFAWTGHGAEEGGWHTLMDVVHLLIAGIWVGALAPLFFSIRAAGKGVTSAEDVSSGLDAFSRIGVVVVGLLIASGIGNALPAWQAVQWSLLQTGYGVTLLAKVAILSGMLVLAVGNRFRFGPRLAVALRQQHSTVAALKSLQRSLALETALALAVLGFAAHLGSMAPPGY